LGCTVLRLAAMFTGATFLQNVTHLHQLHTEITAENKTIMLVVTKESNLVSVFTALSCSFSVHNSKQV